MDKKTKKLLEESMEVRKNELQELRNQAEAAEPGEKVILEKAAERLEIALSALQKSVEAVTYQEPKQPDSMTLAKGLEKFIQRKKQEVEKAEKIIADADQKITDVQQALEKAIQAGEPENIVKYSEELENEKQKRAYLQPVLEQAQAFETFPEGSIAEEWRTISEKFLPEWNTRLDRVRFLADCYRDACNDMTALYNMLCETRRSIQNIGREHGSNEEIIRYNQIFTRGMSSKDVQFLNREDTDTISNALFSRGGGQLL